MFFQRTKLVLVAHIYLFLQSARTIPLTLRSSSLREELLQAHLTDEEPETWTSQVACPGPWPRMLSQDRVSGSLASELTLLIVSPYYFLRELF